MTAELMTPEPNVYVLAGRVLIAAVLGAALGFEREWRGKEAGLRTNTLIALGAALFTAMSVELGAGGGDSARIAAQVVTGVGFLGAGAILHHGGTVQGLTTAAMIWVNASIGVAAGAGHVRLAVAVTAIVLLTMVVLSPVDTWLQRKRPAGR